MTDPTVVITLVMSNPITIYISSIEDKQSLEIKHYSIKDWSGWNDDFHVLRAPNIDRNIDWYIERLITESYKVEKAKFDITKKHFDKQNQIINDNIFKQQMRKSKILKLNET